MKKIFDENNEASLAQLRKAALQTSGSILTLQRRAEEKLLETKKTLEKRSEELASSFSLLNATLESTADGIMATDLAGNVISYNKQLVELWGFPSHLLEKRNGPELMYFAARQVKAPEPFLQRLCELDAKPENEAFDVIELKDGRTFERYRFPQRVNGECVGVVHNWRDVTERKRAEAALRESEESLRTLTESLPQIVWTARPDGSVDYYNNAWYAYSGLTFEESGNKSWGAILHPDDLQRSLDRWQYSVETGEDYEIEYRFRRGSDGAFRWHLGRAIPLRAPSGNIIKWFGTCTDIHDYKLAEQDLAFFAAIVDSSHDAIISKTLDGVITSWNNGAERLFGYRAEEVIGKPITILFPPGQLDEEASILARLKRGERLEHYETVRVRKSGEFVDISLTVSPIRSADGTIIGVSKIARDITERRRHQKERERLLAQEQAAREEAESANRAKDEFLAIVSHELRTPLTPMLGWTEMLLEEGIDDTTLSMGLESILRNVKVQARLVEDLLDVSRIITGKMNLKLQPVELDTVIREALSIVRSEAEAKDITLVTAIDAGIGPVSGDSQRLQQSVWNLLVNAIKFTPAGGRVEVHLRQAGDCAQIQVRDTGIGIDPEFLPHVFERLRQADSSSTRGKGGLGLGLSIVRHMIELHGGTVQAASAGEGQGTTFTITLPLATTAPSALSDTPAQDLTVANSHGTSEQNGNRPNSALNAKGKEPAPDVLTSLAGLKVLVVEDETDSRNMVATLLHQHGAEVAAAASASEAITTLQQFRPDVLVSDVAMPGEDGYSLMRRVRGLAPEQGGQTQAIALTAYAGDESRAEAVSAGYQGHLAKPTDVTALVTMIADLATKTASQNAEG